MNPGSGRDAYRISGAVLKLSLPRGTTPLGRIFEHLAWLISGKGVGALLSLVYLAIITRTLGPEDFGRFSLIFGAATALALLIGFDFWRVMVKFGQHHVRDRDGLGLGRLIALGAAADLTVGLLGIAIAAGIIFGFGGRLGLSPTLEVEALAFAAALLLSLRSTPMGVLRLFNRFDASTLSETVVPVMRMLGAAVALAVGPSVGAFLVAWAVAEIACAATYWILALRAARAEVGPLGIDNFHLAIREPGLKAFMGVTHANSSLVAVSSQAPVLLVGALIGPVQAGLYRLSWQISQSMTKMTALFSRSLYSELAHVSAIHSRDELRILVRRTTLMTIGAAIVSVIAILLVGKPILLAISGPEYAGAFPLLAILGTAAAIDMAGSGFEPLLLATNAAVRAMTFRIVSLVVLLAGLALLLPAFGVAGGAWAVLITAVVNFAMAGVAAWFAIRAPRPPA